MSTSLASIAALLALPAFGQPPSGEIDRTFRFVHTEAERDLQEIATAIRLTAEIREASTDTAQKTLAVRGNADQVALAEWLLQELDAEGKRDAGRREYRVAAGGDEVVRVFYAPDTATVRDFQEVATMVRSIVEIRRLFTYNAPRAVVARGTAGQMAMAEWLFQELDATGKRDVVAREYRVPAGGDDVVRVFYLTHADTAQRLQDVAVDVRMKTMARRLFTYNAPRAIAIRGTADQVAMADRLIRESDR